jgi:hypothetical protein
MTEESKKIHWIIGDKKVDSQFEAYNLFLQDTTIESRLCFGEDQYDKIDFTKESKKSWEDLCLEHAIRLRQKYKKLKLFFSAGRDSGCVWRIFERAKIPIDELVIPYNLYSPLRRREHFNHILPIAKELCRKNPGMIIREMVQGKEWYEEKFGNSDWLTRNNSHNSLMFTIRKWDDAIKKDPDYESGNCGYIFGFEKPALKLIDGNFYCQIQSHHLNWAPQNVSGVEFFYWYHEIYAKQCWLLVNYLEKEYPKCSSEFLEEFQKDDGSVYYDEFCKAIGRGEAISWACGNGLNKLFGNNHWSVQYVLKIAKAEKWKSINEYHSVFEELKKNYPLLLAGTDRANLNTINCKKYFIKKQN